MKEDYTEARFILAFLLILASIVALFTRHMDQEHFVAVVTIVLGLYSAHSIADDKLRDRKDAPP